MADGLAPCQEHSGAETETLKAADLSVKGQKLGVLMVIRRALFFGTPGWLAAVLSLLLAAPVQAADRFASVEVAPQAITEGVYMLTGADGNNIGVTTVTDSTLIIDDQFTPPANKVAAALTNLGGGGTVDGYIKNLRSVISAIPADITIIRADHARRGEL